MYYDQDFARSFMKRTLAIADDYQGQYDGTLLINCLLGLLVIPHETLHDKIPSAPLSSLIDWGISPESIKSFGKCEYGHEHEPNLRQIVRRMRNAVSHFKVIPLQRHKEVIGYSFKDRNGFHAEVSLSELKLFVKTLAMHLNAQA